MKSQTFENKNKKHHEGWRLNLCKHIEICVLIVSLMLGWALTQIVNGDTAVPIISTALEVSVRMAWRRLDANSYGGGNAGGAVAALYILNQLQRSLCYYILQISIGLLGPGH